GTLAVSATVNLASEVSGVLPVLNGGSPFDTTNNGAIIERITTQDFLLGATATASARFAVTNIAGGTPTASLSAAAGGAFMSANGQLQTTNNQSLALGGGNSGNINLSSLTLANAGLTVPSGQSLTLAGLTNNGGVLY